MVLVSHDRYIVDRLATKMLAVGRGTIKPVPVLQQFLWSRTERARGPAPQLETSAASGIGADRGSDSSHSRKKISDGPRRRESDSSCQRAHPRANL